MLNHHNPKYDTGIPLAVGDRYYTQDVFRDMRYYQFNLGQTIEKIAGGINLILDGLQVTQGTGYTLNITAGMGIVPFTVTILNRTDPWALPPNTETVDINMFPTIEADLTDQAIVGSTTDGVTTNYVKLAYAEDDQNTRTREKKAGSYAYEVQPSYVITTNSTAPTSYEITLATFTSDGVDITFTYGDSTRVANLNKLSKYQIASITSTLESYAKYLATGSAIDLTLPVAPLVGDIVEVYSLDDANEIIPNDDQVILYNDNVFTNIGSFGALRIPRQCQVSLVYTGEDAALLEIVNYKVDNPTTLPTGTGTSVAFSPDGNFMAVGHVSSPFITIYSISGTTFTKLTNPGTLPPNTSEAIAFSPDGNFMAIAHIDSPYVTIYSISGTTFTKLTNPGTLPAGTGEAVAFSPDGNFLAVGHFTSPFITIYSISGTTFTKLTNPGILPTGTGEAVAFSPDGNFLAVAHFNSPYVTIYSISGTTFTKLADPGTLPAGPGEGVAFSPDGNFLAVAHATSPFITIYSISGTTFTKLTNPGTLPAGTGEGVAFSPDGNFMGVAHDNSPYITIYSISGITFTKIDNPATLPPDDGNFVAFYPSGNFLSVAHLITPFVTIYKNLVNNQNIWNVLDISPKNGETIADLFT